MSGAASKSPATGVCLHCATAMPATDDDPFCCRGCAEVYRLLHDEGLDRYYDLGGGAGHPVVLRGEPKERDHKWLEPIVARLTAETGLHRIVLDVQGVHCAACVWLFEELFRRAKGDAIVVNPAIGSVELTIDSSFSLERFIDEIEAFGYRFGPALKESRAKSAGGDLVWRMGVCIAIAMNTMIFGIAIYCGLSDGPVYRLFHALDFGLSFVSVLVGGSVFFRSAWRALQKRVLHLDLPIALGILLVFASSTYTYATRGGNTSYFDTLNVFIALMLVGRFLQERVLAKNRAMILASDGAEGLYTRRLRDGGRVELLRCTEIEVGDALVIGHHDLVPVDATLLGEEPATFSLDWISGESAPRAFKPGHLVPAGAFAAGARSSIVQARSTFDGSSIGALLRTAAKRDHDLPRATAWHRSLTKIYVGGVLAVATIAFVSWLVATHDLARTLDVVAALLIVTCPCAFGIATPLAYELAQARLRRMGLFVRTPGFLDRAAEVTRVVFDKTGTLTTGTLAVLNARALDLLRPSDRARLYALAIRSSHPKSRAIALALQERYGAFTFDGASDVVELPGKGLELREGKDRYRLGAPPWATALARIARLGRAGKDVVFTKNGLILASLELGEELRRDARDEVRALKGSGYEAFVLSGDTPEATVALAAASDIDEKNAFGARTPQGKVDWLRAHEPAKTLFVGDGLNDSLVAEEAYCAGTPAIDRPFMAARCDFYFVTPGLRPIREALATARKLSVVVKRNLAIALVYNSITVTLAALGLMTPLLCAVLMPVSSVTTVLATALQLRGRTSWKS